MGNGKGATLLEQTIQNSGGCAIVDGGLATQLEKHGAHFDDSLWSALYLIKDPLLIKRVHLEYLEAGADILVTSSYQASLQGFLSRGLSMQEAELLLERSVRLAIDARDEFWNAVNKNADNHYNRALVAASIGSYGAYLADGSEYSGLYGQNIGVTELKDFHRRRLQVLAGAIPDILAFETIPNKLETQAIVELLEDENIQIPSWICFSSVDGEHAPSGESFGECLKRQQKDPNKQEPSQSKVYKESRKRNPKKAYKTSSSISQANMEKMDALETQQSQGGEANIKDPYYEVIQKPEHSGRVRLFGIGVTKSSLKVKGSTTNKYIIPQEFLQSIEMQVVENIREANPRPHIVMPNGPSSQVEESNGGHHLVGAPSPNDREANLSGEVDINPKEQSIVQQNNNPEVQVESNGLVGSRV